MLSTQEKSAGENFALFCFFSSAHTRRFPPFSRDGRLRANVPFSFPPFPPKCQKMRFPFWKATLRTHANGASETKCLGKLKKNSECCQNLPPHYSGNAEISFFPVSFFKVRQRFSHTLLPDFFSDNYFANRFATPDTCLAGYLNRQLIACFVLFFAAGKFGEITIMHHCP